MPTSPGSIFFPDHPERFHQTAQTALKLGGEAAEASRHSFVGTEHLLLGLIQAGGSAADVLANLGVDEGAVRPTIESQLGHDQSAIPGVFPTHRLQLVLNTAEKEAEKMGATVVGTEHLLLALLIDKDGFAAHMLADKGASLSVVRSQIRAADN